MSDITTPDALTQAPSLQESGSTLSDAFKTNPRLSSSVLVDRLASLLNSSNSRPVVEGLKLVAEIANISLPSPVSPSEEQQATVAIIRREDIRRVGAALAATIRDESARFDWQAHPSFGGFLRQMYGRHPEAQEALVTGAMLNARALRPRALKNHAPLPPSPVPSPAATPTVPPSDSATVSPLITLPCITCKQAPRRPRQRTCKDCHADAMRESRRRKRARDRAAALPQPTSQWPPNPSQDHATCEWCEQTFKPLHWGQRFCSNICGGKAATAVLEAKPQRRAEGRQSIARGPAWNRGNSKPSVAVRARVREQPHWDPRLVERLKNIVADVPKHPGGKPETIRVSALPMGHHLYADVRVYLRGHPTRQGLVVHHDLIVDVITGLQEVLQRGWKP